MKLNIFEKLFYGKMWSLGISQFVLMIIWRTRFWIRKQIFKIKINFAIKRMSNEINKTSNQFGILANTTNDAINSINKFASLLQ